MEVLRGWEVLIGGWWGKCLREAEGVGLRELD